MGLRIKLYNIFIMYLKKNAESDKYEPTAISGYSFPSKSIPPARENPNVDSDLML